MTHPFFAAKGSWYTEAGDSRRVESFQMLARPEGVWVRREWQELPNEVAPGPSGPWWPKLLLAGLVALALPTACRAVVWLAGV